MVLRNTSNRFARAFHVCCLVQTMEPDLVLFKPALASREQSKVYAGFHESQGGEARGERDKRR